MKEQRLWILSCTRLISKSYTYFRAILEVFSKFEYEDVGIFQFFKRIRIPHFFLDFWVGEWTTLEQKSNFRNFSRAFSNFRGEDGTILLCCLRIRIL